MSTATPVVPPRLELVVAVARNGVIGRGNALPWHLPEDLKRFKHLTLGQPILMGRRTWDSLRRPLPGRLNLVLTRAADLHPTGATVVHGLDAALAAAGAAAVVRVIGGAEVYRLCLPAASVLHLTEVDADVPGDTYFPDWQRDEWLERAREPHPADDRHAFPYSFVTLERRARSPA